LIGVAALGIHLLVGELGMFPDWDESVLFSQSGGLSGIPSNQVSYSASREPGTPLLIAGLRALGMDLATVRFSFALIYVSLGTLAFHLLVPNFGAGALVGWGIMMVHWIPLAYSTRLYGVPIAAALLTLGIASALRLFTSSTRSSRNLWTAALSVSTAGMLAMRHLEAPLAASALYGTLIAFALLRARQLLRNVIFAAIAAIAMASFLDWWRAIEYHTSVGDWIEALSTQLSNVPINEDGPLTRLMKLVASLGSGYHMRFRDRLPLASTVSAALGIVVLCVAGVVSRRGRRDEPLRTAPTTRASDRRLVVWVACLVFVGYLALFVFGRYPSFPKDRYLIWLVVSGAILAGTWSLRIRTRAHYIAVAGAIAFLLGSGVVAARVDLAYFRDEGERIRHVGHAMHVMADGRECRALSLYTPPALQLASGCVVRGVADASSARSWLEEESPDGVRFLVFPVVPELEGVPGWSVVAPEGSHFRLWFRESE
jgi:hypothetical protein